MRSHMLFANMLAWRMEALVRRRWRFKADHFGSIVTRTIACDLSTFAHFEADRIAAMSQTRRQNLEDAIARFDHIVGDVVEAVDGTAKSCGALFTDVRGIVDDVANGTRIAASSACETDKSVSLTVAATDELSASIQDINGQAARNAALVSNATTAMDGARSSIANLASLGEEIGSVVQLIAQVAAQTNLLALNATIEAARAGKDGRGFAVVASEVKELARQTSLATNDISHRITSIQDETRTAVGEIARVAEAISQITTATTMIAAAVEQQENATQAVSRNLAVAADQTFLTVSHMDVVESSVTSLSTRSLQMAAAAKTLSGVAENLSRCVGRFFDEMRAA
jgi:methyl-accepting chemotaxis protein